MCTILSQFDEPKWLFKVDPTLSLIAVPDSGSAMFSKMQLNAKLNIYLSTDNSPYTPAVTM